MTLLRIKCLSKKYSEVPVLQDINFHLNFHEICIMLGENGAGKSTLLDCIARRADPSTGEIEILGRSYSKDPFAYKKALGYALNVGDLPLDLRVEDFLKIYIAAHQVDWEKCCAKELFDSLTLEAARQKKIGELSFGNKQKLAIVAAFIGTPSLVLLDESFNGLDPLSCLRLRVFILKYVRQYKCSVVIATHVLALFVDTMTVCIFIKEGRIAQNCLAIELKKKAEHMGVDTERFIIEKFYG